MLMEVQIAQKETLMKRLTKDQQQYQANQCQLRNELKLLRERSASKKEVDLQRQSQRKETCVLKQNFDRNVQRIDHINKQQSDQIAQLNQQQSASEWWLKFLRAIIIVLIAIIAILCVHVYHLEQHTLQSDLPG